MRWWPWNRQRTPSEQPQDAPSAALSTQIAELTAQVSQLTSDLAGIRLEWAETLDKLNRWSSRQSARQRRETHQNLDHLAADGPEDAEDAPGATNGAGVESGSLADRAARKAALRAQFNRR